MIKKNPPPAPPELRSYTIQAGGEFQFLFVQLGEQGSCAFYQTGGGGSFKAFRHQRAPSFNN